MSEDLSPTIMAVQYELQRRGLYLGKIDGIAGPKTWAEIHFALGAPAAYSPAPVADDTAVVPPAENAADPRSEQNIATLLPFVRPVARDFLQQVDAAFAEAQNFVTAKIISGTRTYSEQDSLYALGRTATGKIVTNARAGYSAHNHGIAFDIGLFDDRGNYLDDSPLYDWAGKIGKSLGLEWGGDWHSIQDKPHFELRPDWAAQLSEDDMMVELRRRHVRGEAIA